MAWFFCVCFILFHTWSRGLVMNPDGLLLPLAAGLKHGGPMTEQCCPPSLAGANTSLDRRVSVEEMGRELVDVGTAASSVDVCLDTRGIFIFSSKGHLFVPCR